MEEQKPQGHPEGCRCFQCRCGTDCKCGHGWHGHRHFLLRFLVGIIILVIVFAVGVKLGELKSSFGHGHYSGGRHYMMQPYGTMPQLLLWGIRASLSADDAAWSWYEHESRCTEIAIAAPLICFNCKKVGTFKAPAFWLGF